MSQPLPPAGWYPDPSGEPGQRYFDGVDWTEHFSSTPVRVASNAERMAVLDQAIMAAVSRGARVESRTQFQAVVVYGHRANHVLHAILMIFTCFLWAIVWLFIGSGNEVRQVLQVDQYGKLLCT